MKIEHDVVFISVESQINTDYIIKGEIFGLYKTNNVWLHRQNEGKLLRAAQNIIQNDNYFKVLKQYSMSDIIYYLLDKHPDCQTVMWDMLEDAINTTFDEACLCTIDDICEYISKNLI